MSRIKIKDFVRNHIITTSFYSQWTTKHRKKIAQMWLDGEKKPPLPAYLKEQIIRFLRNGDSTLTLIETGTFKAEMTYALNKDFSQIHSIELNPTLAEFSKCKLKKFKHIKIHTGNSAEVLPAIIKDLPTKSIFWLDAHYSGGETSGNNQPAPILNELKAIFSKPEKVTAVLIDDARLFKGTGEYPTFDAVKKYVSQLYSDAKVSLIFQDLIYISNCPIKLPSQEELLK